MMDKCGNCEHDIIDSEKPSELHHWSEKHGYASINCSECDCLELEFKELTELERARAEEQAKKTIRKLQGWVE